MTSTAKENTTRPYNNTPRGIFIKTKEDLLI
uniref:Uncharacterized protein n=1 Tax=Siphoviridae sp. ctGMq5 TaxID=2826220 RepID=A0A8S5NNV6_9CAUD|nr:MAG TPA: hypothetical protein [Siphoviridae sp. ctGMq5]DAT94175.1 MAG TPA: hypothetical protein [Caudoviricetes sp.]